MSCDCQNEIASKIADSQQEQHPDWSEIKVTLLGYALTFGSNLSSRGFMPLSIEAERPLKKGGSRLKKEKTNLFFTYCPFCGVKVNDDSDGAES